MIASVVRLFTKSMLSVPLNFSKIDMDLNINGSASAK